MINCSFFIEYCDPIGMIVLDKGGQRRRGLTGLGVASLMAVGVTDAMLKGAIELIGNITEEMGGRAKTIGARLYAELKEHLDGGGSWEVSPVARIPASVTKQRVR